MVDPSVVNIRSYDAERDEPGLRACFVALQDAEHQMIPAAPTGAAIVDAYLKWMLQRCVAYDGHIYVADLAGEVVGFVGVLAAVPRSEPDDSDASHAFVGELSVLPSHRSGGIGRALLDRAMAYAREHGASNVRLAIVAENEGARRMYLRAGFRVAVETLICRFDS